uniref:Ig-like domain-containing protein n=1 Tax=Salarias fasciatus TaxID=181472 RepID=A0A672HFK7_SALFA
MHEFMRSHNRCRAQKDNVLQPRGEVTADEGHSVTLDCLYNTSSSSNDYLFWYKQEGNKSPKFILSRFKVGEGKTEDEEKYSSTLDSSLRSVPLKIQKLELSDSAVYYCALQPTVTGNSSTVDENLWIPTSNHIYNDMEFYFITHKINTRFNVLIRERHKCLLFHSWFRDTTGQQKRIIRMWRMVEGASCSLSSDTSSSSSRRIPKHSQASRDSVCPEPPPARTCPDHLPREASRRRPKQIPSHLS